MHSFEHFGTVPLSYIQQIGVLVASNWNKIAMALEIAPNVLMTEMAPGSTPQEQSIHFIQNLASRNLPIEKFYAACHSWNLDGWSSNTEEILNGNGKAKGLETPPPHSQSMAIEQSSWNAASVREFIYGSSIRMPNPEMRNQHENLRNSLESFFAVSANRTEFESLAIKNLLPKLDGFSLTGSKFLQKMSFSMDVFVQLLKSCNNGKSVAANTEKLLKQPKVQLVAENLVKFTEGLSILKELQQKTKATGTQIDDSGIQTLANTLDAAGFDTLSKVEMLVEMKMVSTIPGLTAFEAVCLTHMFFKQ